LRDIWVKRARAFHQSLEAVLDHDP
jgi:hypothetical protein